MTLAPFGAALAIVEDIDRATDELCAKLNTADQGGTLGLLYVIDRLKGDLKAIVEKLKAKTCVSSWIGTVGLGVIGGSQGVFDQPATAAIIGTWDKAQFDRPVTLLNDIVQVFRRSNFDPFAVLMLIETNQRNGKAALLLIILIGVIA